MLTGANSLGKRRDTRLLARLKVRYGNGESLNAGLTENISRRGLFFKGNVLFPRRSLIRVEVITPQGEHIVFIGRVCWVRQASPFFPRIGTMGGMGISIARFIEGAPHYLMLCNTLQARA